MEDLKPSKTILKDNDPRQHVLGNSPKTAGLRSGQVILKPGEEIGEHSTKDREEAIVIFEGRAEISSDKGEAIKAEKDSVVYMPPNTLHNVKNTGKDILRYIYIVK